MTTTLPSTPPDRRGADFHDAIAASWNAGYRSGALHRRLQAFDVILARTVSPGEVWIDAGCGTGTLTALLARDGATGAAIDGAVHMVEQAVTLNRGLSGVFTFSTVASLYSTGIDDRSVDGVLCSSVIEYLQFPEQALREFCRILRPGGKLVVSVPNAHSPLRALQKIGRSAAALFGARPWAYLEASINEYTGIAFRSLLRVSGFEIESWSGFDPIGGAPNPPIPPMTFIVVARRV